MRRTFLAVLLFCQIASAEPPQIADGPFKGELDSLKQYQCPDWFRDAKFGIWAHWGPQAVPMEGDWYAKHMYVQGTVSTNTTWPPTDIPPYTATRTSSRCGRPRSGIRSG